MCNSKKFCIHELNRIIDKLMPDDYLDAPITFYLQGYATSLTVLKEELNNNV